MSTRVTGIPLLSGTPALKLTLVYDQPYQGGTLGLSLKSYTATWDYPTTKWLDPSGTELSVPLPRVGQNDPALKGNLKALYTATYTGGQSRVAEIVLAGYETSAGVLDLTVDPAPIQWAAASSLTALIAATDAARLNAVTATGYANTAAASIGAATTAASTAAANATTALGNLNASVATAATQAAAAGTAAINTAVANVVAGSGITGQVNTPANLPTGQANGTQYVVLSTGTVWKYATAGTVWTDTGLGSRPISEIFAATTGLSLKKARDASGPVHVLRGHSLMYGLDTSATGTKAATNGAPQTRNPQAPTDSYSEMLGYLQSSASVVNQGFPGDQTKDALTRWAGATVGDVLFIWLDTNDANNYSGDAGGPATIAQSQARLAQIIRDAKNRGTQVIVMGGGPIDDLSVTTPANGLGAGSPDHNVRAYWAAQREVALNAGAAAVLNVREVLRDYAAPWTDGIHYVTAAYAEVGSSMAALSGPYGVTPPSAHPGARIGPRMLAHGGGAVVNRGGSTDGAVIRLTAGQVCVLPIMVTDACELHLDLFSDSGGFDGQGTLIYALGAVPDKPGRPIRQSGLAAGILPVRGHSYSSGPRCVIVSCTSGTLEIDGFRFVPRPTLLTQPVGATAPRLHRSVLAGQIVGSSGSGYQAAVDPGLPVTTVAYDGTASTARIRLAAALPDGGTSNGLLLCAATNTGLPYLIRSGYQIFRSNSALYVREWQRENAVRTVSLGTPFAAGTFQGVLDVTVDSSTLTVTVDGVSAGSISGVLYRHFIPGVAGEGIVRVFALSAETL